MVGGGDQFVVGQVIQVQFWIEGVDGSVDGIGQYGIFGSLVVECVVWFDVGQVVVFGVYDGIKCIELIEYVVDDVFGW